MTIQTKLTAYFNKPDSKVHGVNMDPIWVLSAPDGPHVGPMNLAIRECQQYNKPAMYVIGMLFI